MCYVVDLLRMLSATVVSRMDYGTGDPGSMPAFQPYYPILVAGEMTPAVGSAGNKLSGFRRLPTLNEKPLLLNAILETASDTLKQVWFLHIFFLRMPF